MKRKAKVHGKSTWARGREFARSAAARAGFPEGKLAKTVMPLHVILSIDYLSLNAIQPKAKQKAGAKGGDAWEAAPEKPLRLRVKDVRNTLKERWLQLFWPEDGRWWPGQVLDIRCKERKVHLLYKTGARPAPRHTCLFGL